MACVLIAWELGEAFGHLARCLRLAKGLVARGHEVTLALKEVRLPAGQGLAPGITVLLAPLTPQAGADRSPPVNYADVLRVSGFADAQDVAARLNAWRGILSLARPDVVVADHAPTALLAAHLAGVPHLAIGNGFVIPPAVSPWPSIRPWAAVSDQALIAHRVEALGAGKLLGGRIDADSITQALQELLGSEAYRQAARAFQDRHRHFSTGQAIEQSLSLIERAFLDGWNADRTRHAQEPQESPPACLH